MMKMAEGSQVGEITGTILITIKMAAAVLINFRDKDSSWDQEDIVMTEPPMEDQIC